MNRVGQIIGTAKLVGYHLIALTARRPKASNHSKAMDSPGTTGSNSLKAPAKLGDCSNLNG